MAKKKRTGAYIDGSRFTDITLLLFMNTSFTALSALRNSCMKIQYVSRRIQLFTVTLFARFLGISGSVSFLLQDMRAIVQK